MKTALKLYHHSIFKVPKAATGANVPIRGNKNKDRRGRNDTTTDGPFEERKINVELTVGGGGNTDYRKQRIKEKNEKLNDERARRAQEEQRIKDKKAREKAGKGDDEEEGKKSGGGMEDAIHPSRRRHLEGASS
ncbi:hypothetical protein GGR57DRAFT_452793 [Xylariaceae sp. FL1272]|nr:hypothetical protein GGR57DRAFT_452793 [Xylariaceae sp. FL1272]